MEIESKMIEFSKEIDISAERLDLVLWYRQVGYIFKQLNYTRYIDIIVYIKGGKMFEEIKSIIIEQLDVEEEQISINSKIIDDLGADSLDLLEIMTSEYGKYEIKISKDKIEKLKTIGDILKLQRITMKKFRKIIRYTKLQI